jgi:hypothetical protein
MIKYILLSLLLISCSKDSLKKQITITPTLTTQDNKWVINFNFSDSINTQGTLKFYWVVSDSTNKSYKWFGSVPFQPGKKQSYESGIPSFKNYKTDSINIEVYDYNDKYEFLINR